jgi:hypothetical protein
VTGTSDTVTVTGTSDAVTLSGVSDSVTASSTTLTLSGASSSAVVTGVGNTISVAGANSTLTAVGDSNTLEAGTGVSTLVGDGNQNKYLVGSGSATIDNTSTSGAASGELDFQGSVPNTDLWFEQSGNNLLVDVLGTNQQVTIGNWFSNTSNELQDIVATNGQKIDSSGVSLLVQAMATYEQNNPTFNPTVTSQVPNDSALQTVMAANWHA